MSRSFVLFGIAMCLAPGCRGGGDGDAPGAAPATPAAVTRSAPLSPGPSPAPISAPSKRPPWRAIREAEAACADCHPDEVAAWTASPMGRSMGPATPMTAGAPDAPITHPSTGERFTVSPDGLRFAEIGGVRRAASHAVGSGSHTRSFVHRFAIADGAHRAELMPLTWYRAAGWGLSPGYDVPGHPGFHRAMNLECLTCHNDPAATAPGDDERFVEPFAAGIGCARCHGDGRAHVAARMAGAASPPVMPDRLDPSLGADVCGQCHLQGAVRLLRAGRAWDDFMPGEPLGEVIAVFVRQTAGARIGIASHAERLQRSRCATRSPEARRCTTCHTPHATGAQPDRSAACRDCHGAGEGHGAACTGAGGEDCAGCHMARSATHDIPHVSMTDHFIRRRPEASSGPQTDTGPLVWINRPDGVSSIVADRLLGRAWAESARARVSSADRDRALALLEPALKTAPDDPAAWVDLGSMKVLAGDLGGARAAMEEAVGRASRTPGADRAQWWADLAQLRLQTGAVAEASAALAKARALRPGHLDDTLTEVRIAAARGDGATVDARLRAFEAEGHGRNDGQRLRGALALATLDPRAADEAFSAAAAREPGDPRAWLSLCRLRADRQQWDTAHAACDKAMNAARGGQAVARVAGARARVALGRGDPETAAELASAAMRWAPADASLVLGRVALASGRFDEALGLLDRTVQLDPTIADAWTALADVLRRRGETALAERAAAQARRLGGL